MLDDIGVDVIKAYLQLTPGVSSSYVTPKTPNIDSLAVEGVHFSRAWVNPVCSPTRSGINTGRYSFRHGIGRQIFKNSGDLSLPLTEKTIPEMLRDALGASAYECGVFGKWHMEGDETNIGVPLSAGYDYYEGNLFAVEGSYCNGYTEDYTDPIDGTVDCRNESQYLMSAQFNDAEAWISGIDPSQPYFCYLAVQGPYEMHMVPDRDASPSRFDITNYPTMLAQDPGSCAACTVGSGQSEIDFKRECYVAQTELIDTELGELLNALDARAFAITGDPAKRWYDTTTIFLLGDNGTPGGGVITDPFPVNQKKGTLYEGGIRIPFYIAGSAVTASMRGTFSRALVNGVDIYATVAAIAGVFDDPNISTLNDIGDPNGTFYADNRFDSVDLTPLLTGAQTSVRAWIYSELWVQNHAPSALPHLYGDRRAILGYFDDGDGDSMLGTYKLWRTPMQAPILYSGSGYQYLDDFYELEVSETPTDYNEASDLISNEPMSQAREDAYNALSAALDALLDPANQTP